MQFIGQQETYIDNFYPGYGCRRNIHIVCN